MGQFTLNIRLYEVAALWQETQGSLPNGEVQEHQLLAKLDNRQGEMLLPVHWGCGEIRTWILGDAHLTVYYLFVSRTTNLNKHLSCQQIK